MDNVGTDRDKVTEHLDLKFISRHSDMDTGQQRQGQMDIDRQRRATWTTQRLTQRQQRVTWTSSMSIDTDTEETDNVDTARDTATEPMMDDEVVIV